MADITQSFRKKDTEGPKKEQASEEMTIHDIADKYAKVYTESSRTLKVPGLQGCGPGVHHVRRGRRQGGPKEIDAWTTKRCRSTRPSTMGASNY